MLQGMLQIFLVAVIAHVGWSVGGRVIYVWNMLLGLLPYSISKHLNLW
jgi:hypothetical protein